MILKNKLRECRMTHSDNVTSYLMRITQIHDQLVAIKETVQEAELVNVALNWVQQVLGTIHHGHLCLGASSQVGETLG
jgi:hypothetical protein